MFINKMSNNLKHKICSNCMTEFETYNGRVKNCEKCQLQTESRKNEHKKIQREEKKKSTVKTCPHCAKEFSPPAGKGGIYVKNCEECRLKDNERKKESQKVLREEKKQITVKTCPHCAKEFTPPEGKNGIYFKNCEDCRLKDNERKKESQKVLREEKKKETVKTCPHCSKEFSPPAGKNGIYFKNCEECRLKDNERKNKEQKTERRKTCAKCDVELGSTCHVSTMYCGSCKLKNKREDSANRRQDPVYRAKEFNYYDKYRSTYEYKIANDSNFKKSAFLDRYYSKKDEEHSGSDEKHLEEEEEEEPEEEEEEEIDFENRLNAYLRIKEIPLH